MSRLYTLVMDNRDLLEFSYPGSLTILSATPLDNGYFLHTGNNFDGYINTVLQNETELYWGGFMNPNNSANNEYIYRLYSDGTQIGGVRYQNSANRLDLIIGSSVVATTATLISPVTTYHIQGRFKLHSSVGVFELKVNNTTETLTYNGNTTNGQSRVNRFAFAATGSGARHDSFWLNNTSGSTNIGYMGVLRMKILPFLANSAVANHNQFTKTTGSDAAAILDKTPYTADDDYIWTSTDNQKQFMTVTPHGLLSPALIHSFDARYVVMMVGGGRVEPNVMTPENTSSADYAGTIQTPGVVPGYIIQRWETNPSTGVAWTLSDTFEMGVRSVIP